MTAAERIALRQLCEQGDYNDMATCCNKIPALLEEIDRLEGVITAIEAVVFSKMELGLSFRALKQLLKFANPHAEDGAV